MKTVLYSLFIIIVIFTLFPTCEFPACEFPEAEDSPLQLFYLSNGLPIGELSAMEWVVDKPTTNTVFERTIYVHNNSNRSINLETPFLELKPDPDGLLSDYVEIQIRQTRLDDGDVLAIKPQETFEIILRYVYTNAGTSEDEREDYHLILHTTDSEVGDFQISIAGIMGSF